MNSRFFVPDLTPLDRHELSKLKPRSVFIAESPHVSEIEPDSPLERRPLCGVAGVQWWSMLGRLLEGQDNPDVSLKRMLDFCKRHKIAVLNAVQYPLDPKVKARYPEADPVKHLSFGKVSGEHSYKKIRTNQRIRMAVKNLEDRIQHFSLSDATFYTLGNDADWFVRQCGMLGVVKIPHPSAWWRKGGHYGRVAEELLSQIFKLIPVSGNEIIKK